MNDQVAPHFTRTWWYQLAKALDDLADVVTELDGEPNLYQRAYARLTHGVASTCRTLGLMSPRWPDRR